MTTRRWLSALPISRPGARPSPSPPASSARPVFPALVFALILSCLALTPSLVHAHTLGQSYIFLTVEGDAVHGRFELTARDLNAALGLGFPLNGRIMDADIARHAPVIERYLHERVDMAVEGRPIEIRFTGSRVGKYHGEQYALHEFDLAGLPADTEAIDVGYRVLFDVDPEHRGLLVIENNFETGTFNNEAGVSLIFGPGEERQRLDLSGGSPWHGFVAMTRLGVHHIWVGIDHILFLVALLLPAVLRRRDGRWQAVDNFRDALVHVIKIVTLFTVAHSITLSIAALGVVHLPSRLVESIIAFSIAVAALDIVVPVFRGRIWIVVFVFGLFHGFGFASVLGDLGISGGHMVLTLLGFNVGVEIGQAAIVCAIFPVLYLLKSTALYTRFALKPAAALLIVVALYWFVERAFSVDLPAYALIRRFIEG